MNEQVPISAKAYGPDIVETVLFEVTGGRTGAHVVAKALEWPADLIVCSTQGHRGIRRLALGSDAEYVVRHAPAPVLLCAKWIDHLKSAGFAVKTEHPEDLAIIRARLAAPEP